MSLDKAVSSGKEKRKPYSGAKAIDQHCRNHGDCKWCLNNRLYSSTRREASIKEKLKEHEKGDENNDSKLV